MVEMFLTGVAEGMPTFEDEGFSFIVVEPEGTLWTLHLCQVGKNLYTFKRN